MFNFEKYFLSKIIKYIAVKKIIKFAKKVPAIKNIGIKIRIKEEKNKFKLSLKYRLELENIRIYTILNFNFFINLYCVFALVSLHLFLRNPSL